VAGHRGRGGELTVRTLGEAGGWLGLRRIRIEGPAAVAVYEVESSRAYRDRLVLKLKGVDDANAAAALRGCRVQVARGEAPELSPGEYYVEELVGMDVVDESGRRIGRVAAVLASGDADVLSVAAEGPGSETDTGADDEEEVTEELLIPLAPGFVRGIDLARRRIDVSVPRELWELNRRPCG
jgi:16S rRNA processing protein RimM